MIGYATAGGLTSDRAQQLLAVVSSISKQLPQLWSAGQELDGQLSALSGRYPVLAGEQVLICACSEQVVLRVRPPLAREMGRTRPFQNAVVVDPTHTVVTLSEDLPSLARGASNSANLVSCTLCPYPGNKDLGSGQFSLPGS